LPFKRKFIMSKPKRNFEPNRPEPTRSKIEGREAPLSNVAAKVINTDLLFGKKNYYFMLGGIGLIIVGMFLMAGGNMPSPDVWDETLIYSTTRILIAPIFIIAGLVMQVFAIFSKKD
jgi:Protein of unknown function (DUF3098)